MVSTGIVRQWMAGLTASLSALTVASSVGWMTVSIVRLLSLESPVAMSTDQSSWVASASVLGMLATSVPLAMLTDLWGRKVCLLLSAPLSLISWVLILHTRCVSALIVARCVQGVALAAVFVALPTYLAEIAEPQCRGALSLLFATFFNLGLLLLYILGPSLSYDNLIYASMTVPLLFSLTFIWQPESPYYFLLKNREKEAMASLSWLRDDNVAVEDELRKIKVGVDEELKEKASWRDLLALPSNRKAFLCVHIVTITSEMSGVAAIMVYAFKTFASSGTSFLTPEQFTVVMGVLNLVTCSFSGCVVDSCGRRPLLLISAIGCGLSEFITGTYFYLNKVTDDFHGTGGSWVPFVTICSYNVLYSLGIGPLLTTMPVELFQSKFRGMAACYSGLLMNLVAFCTIFMYQRVEHFAGLHLNYWSFALSAFVGAIFVYLFVPETKGKTFLEIRKDLSGKD